MTASVPGPAGIFISYRREDAAYPAGWLFDELARHFGQGRLFKDVDSIVPGDDFAAKITTTLKSCSVLLAVIGKQWLTAADSRGRRLDNPADWVRLEIEAAFARGLRVIPVLVDEAKMPSVAELPTGLKALVGRQALELSPGRFRADADRLVRVLRESHAGPGNLRRAYGPSQLVRTLTANTIWRASVLDPSAKQDVAFSPDGNLLAYVGADWSVRLWRATTGAPFRTLTGRGSLAYTVVYTVAFSPDGTLLASAGADNTVRIWQPTTGETIRILTGHNKTPLSRKPGVFAVAFSPDGTLLASAGIDRTVRIWEAATGATFHILTGHTGWVRAVAFSPDGTLLASAGEDKTVRVWQTATGTPVSTLTGHTGRVWAVAFSPDGTLLASGGADRTVRIWEAATGAAIRTLTGHTGRVSAVAFSPDGTLFASAGSDRKVLLWS